MIEQDAVRGVHAVGFAVVDRDPVGIELGRAVGRARIERRRLALRDLLHLAVQLGRRGLVEAHLVLDAEDADGLEQAQGTERVGVGRVLGRLEAHLHVALGGEVVDLVRLVLLDEADEVGGIRHVAVVHEEARVVVVRVDVEVIDARRVERRGPPLHAVDGVALVEQKARQMRAVLTGDAGDQCNFRFQALSPWSAPMAKALSEPTIP